MSSPARNITRAATRGTHYLGRGSKLGIPVRADAPDLLARLAREEKAQTEGRR